jgi:hypothetical protein
VVAVAVIGLAWLLIPEIDQEQGGLTLIGHQAAPEVAAASDLSFALNDMDAQIANVLLVGNVQGLGFTRTQALALYEQRRTQADRDLRLAASSAPDPGTQRSVEKILDALGQYEALAGQAILLDEQTVHPAGRPGSPSLAKYRQATDLLKAQLLPAAQELTDQHARALESTYQTQRTRILSTRIEVLVVGVVVLAALIGLQAFLALRFRRIFAPALVLATGLVAVAVVLSSGLLADEAEHLRVAKKDAFDSILALSQARAVSYDANADESRYLLDPGRAEQYQQAFLAKSEQLVHLPDAELTTWDRQLAAAISAYQGNHADVGWAGFLGTEFRNITFPGERAAAETTLLRYQTYQLDDRQIRALAAQGRLADAVAFCTSYAPGASNAAFSQYDDALAALIAINQHAFDRAISDGENGLQGWVLSLWAGAFLVMVLVGVGIWPRLREYR